MASVAKSFSRAAIEVSSTFSSSTRRDCSSPSAVTRSLMSLTSSSSFARTPSSCQTGNTEYEKSLQRSGIGDAVQDIRVTFAAMWKLRHSSRCTSTSRRSNPLLALQDPVSSRTLPCPLNPHSFLILQTSSNNLRGLKRSVVLSLAANHVRIPR